MRRYLLLQRHGDPLDDYDTWKRVFEVINESDNGLIVYYRDKNECWSSLQGVFSLEFIQLHWSNWEQTFITEEQFKEFIGYIFPDIL